jgi:Raf kinase inhibitor-like YbhB/YbcL family protein
VLVTATALLAAGCGGATTPHRASGRPAPASMTVASSFPPGAGIPRAYTCDGSDLSPPLRATGAPAGTVELAVVVRDLDAAGGTFIHWSVAHIAPHSGAMSLRAGGTPSGAVVGRNSFGTLDYRGPCPPPGDPPHHYQFTVYALSRPSAVSTGFSAGAIGVTGVLAVGRLTGTYSRR